MSFMRLGTRIAVINDENQILLSKRGDFGSWALPGGRVDSGELIHESAAREVLEETGLEVELERPVGLYFQQGRSRMNILYRARPIGGDLLGETDETLDNRFFSPDGLPENLFGRFYIDHAYSEKTYLHTVETPLWELLKLDLKLRWRWIQNLLAGRPEPKFAEFKVIAVGIIRQGDKILMWSDSLPYIVSDGSSALDDALNQMLSVDFQWSWVGLWQNVRTNLVEFVFETQENIVSGKYRTIDCFEGREVKYIERSTEHVWLMGQES